MNADLVGSPGLQTAFEQRGVLKSFERFVMGHRVFAASVCDQRHFLAVGVRTGDRTGYSARQRDRVLIRL